MNINEMTSWGLTKAIYDVIENGFSYDEETGEVYFSSDDLLALQEALDNKMEGICGFIKHAEGKANSLKERKKEIDKTIKYFENKATKLKEFLKFYCESNDITKKEAGEYNIGFRKSSSVSITDEEALMKFIQSHDEYKDLIVTKTETTVNKNELKKVINADIKMPGVELVTNNNIQIS